MRESLTEPSCGDRLDRIGSLMWNSVMQWPAICQIAAFEREVPQITLHTLIDYCGAYLQCQLQLHSFLPICASHNSYIIRFLYIPLSIYHGIISCYMYVYKHTHLCDYDWSDVVCLSWVPWCWFPWIATGAPLWVCGHMVMVMLRVSVMVSHGELCRPQAHTLIYWREITPPFGAKAQWELLSKQRLPPHRFVLQNKGICGLDMWPDLLLTTSSWFFLYLSTICILIGSSLGKRIISYSDWLEVQTLMYSYSHILIGLRSSPIYMHCLTFYLAHSPSFLYMHHVILWLARGPAFGIYTILAKVLWHPCKSLNSGVPMTSVTTGV